MAKPDDKKAKTEKYELTFKGSVTPKATKFLKSEPIEMDYTGTLDLDGTDAANLKTLQKEFQSTMEDRIKGQLDHLNKWLTEKDALVADMVKRYDDMKKGGFPATPQEATQRAKTIEDLKQAALKIDSLKADYQSIVAQWAENCREQQGLIALKLAVKSARIKTFDDKAFRVRAGQVVKGVLIVLAIAASVAAIVVSAGSTAPLFIGLAAAGATLSGISSIAQFGKVISENANMEKRTLASVQKDLESLQDVFSGMKDKKSSLAKHVTALQNLIKVREDNIAKLENEILPHKAAAKSFEADIVKIKGDPTVDQSEVGKKTKAIIDTNSKIAELENKMKAMGADNAKAQELLKGLEALNIDIDKVSTQTPNTLLGNLKERFSKLDGWTDLGNSVGGLVNSASGAHH
jgi:hypothetical protein